MSGAATPPLLEHLEQVTSISSGWKARCPCHQPDRHPSLDIKIEGDRVLAYCHVCHANGQGVIDELGLPQSMLFLGNRRNFEVPPLKSSKTSKIYPDIETVVAAVTADVRRAHPVLTGVNAYTYDSELHQPHAAVVRVDFEGGKEVRPIARVAGGWIRKGPDKRIIYNLPAITENADARIVVVEGEKKAEALSAVPGVVATTSMFGAKSPHKTDWEPLAGRAVELWADNDDAGNDYVCKVAHILMRLTPPARVCRLEWPEAPPKGDAADWMDLHESAEPDALRALFDALPRHAIHAATEASAPVADPLGRPTIKVCAGELRRAVTEAESAMLQSATADAQVFQRGSQLVRIVNLDEQTAPRRGISIPARTPMISVIGNTYFAALFERCAVFYRFSKRTEQWERSDCPLTVVSAYQQSAGHWCVPVLRGVITAPTLRADGTVLQTPGYDAESRLFYDPCGVKFPTIVDRPSIEAARDAVAQLIEPIRLFPFANEGSQAIWLAAVLTALIRPQLPSAPLLVFDAPVAASGKSKLASMAGLIPCGRVPATFNFTDDPDEARKRIFALLLAGTQVINIDNIEVPLGGSSLCTALTEQSFSDRILGVSETATVPTSATWMATGNNVVIAGDLRRRVLVSRLDPQCEKPEERSFPFDPVAMVEANRPRLVAAALTLLRAHVVAGRPQLNLAPFGSFESWSAGVRAPLVWAGQADPLLGRQAVVEADGGSAAMVALAASWRARFGDRSMTLRSVIAEASTDMRDAIDEVIGGDVAPCNVARLLGRHLSQWRDRVIGGYQFIQGNKAQGGVVRWQVVTL